MAQDIIVIGASAGGVEALIELTRWVPTNLPASLFVVQHVASHIRSGLPDILSRSGSLPAAVPRDGEIFQRRRIYVAPADHHMLLEGNRIHLWRGPRENRHRPAINALFRSAAVGYKRRVAGVILSGLLDDGTTGLWWVKHYGGVTVVQDPREAAFPEMVCSAMEHVDVDYRVSVSRMGELFGRLADGPAVEVTR